MSTGKNELATQNASGFLAETGGDISELIRQELDGFDLTFDKVKIPSGGGLAYELPGEDGEPIPVPEFSAVILYHHPLNVYYKTAYQGGNAPPDCFAVDGKLGVKQETGEVCCCDSCPLNEFGSADDGFGKACQNRRHLYILREGECLPMLLSLPATSLTAMREYTKTLLRTRCSSDTVVTRFGLQKAVSKNTGKDENGKEKGNITYSQVKLKKERGLTAEECAYIKKLAEQVKVYSKTAPVANDADVAVDPETGEVIEPLN